MAVHEDLAKYPRVRALMGAIEAQVAQDRSLFKPGMAAIPEAVSLDPDQDENLPTPGAIAPCNTITISAMRHRRHRRDARGAIGGRTA
jgi:hypothetical protein